MLSLQSVFAIIALLFTDKTLGCGTPRRFWCATEEIARECGVYEQCKARLDATNNVGNESPVHVEVYFETYCPDSIKFVTTQLFPAWQTFEASGIMEVTLYVYGKAVSIPQDDGLYKFTCQHGPRECTVNIIENCIIKYSNNDTKTYLPIINCIELDNQHMAASEKCTTEGGVSWNDVKTCSNGDEGNRLMYEAGLATKGLEPRLNFVPWIVINGVHTDDIESAALNDLKGLVCETYSGNKPAECGDLGDNPSVFVH